jgi:putative peptidoglycan lipid II flippase
VIGIIVLGKVTAYGRDATLSAFYGASSQTDALFVANNVPNLVFSAFFASIAIVFLPVYNRVRVEQGVLAAEEFGGNVITVYLILALGLSAVCLLFAPALVSFMAPAFNAPTHTLAVDLTRIVSCSFVFTSVSGILSSIQYASKRYTGPQLIPTINNLLTAGAVVLFASTFGIYVAAIAATLAWAAQVLIQGAFVRKTFRYRPRLNLTDKALRKMSWMLLPVLVSVSMEQVYILTDNILGSTLSAGSISALNYSQRLLNVATGTFVLAITTVMFPQFSEYVIGRKTDALYAAMDRCIGAIVLVLAPVMVIIFAFSVDIVALAFKRGAFNDAATTLTALLFSYYALGVVFGAVRDTLNRVHYAMQDTRTPLILSALAMVIKVILSLALVQRMGAAGLALATSIATATYCILQFVVFRRRLGGQFHVRLPRILGQTLIAVIAMTAVILVYTAMIPTHGRLLGFLAPTLLGMGAYLAVLLYLKVEDVALAWGTVVHMVKPT